jgi:hypothetical protein
MTKDKEPLQAKMGRAGETIVMNYHMKNGDQVIVSVDQYDSKKDMLVEGKSVEVKTQVPFVMKDAFTFRESQLEKCLNVDYVYFVSVPASNRPHHSYGKVYRIESKDLQYQTITTKDSRTMIMIPISQPGMEELFVMSEDEQNILSRYSMSSWR